MSVGEHVCAHLKPVSDAKLCRVTAVIYLRKDLRDDDAPSGSFFVDFKRSLLGRFLLHFPNHLLMQVNGGERPEVPQFIEFIVTARCVCRKLSHLYGPFVHRCLRAAGSFFT
jgi:hypothetical protein